MHKTPAPAVTQPVDALILTKKKYHEIIFSSELKAESGLMFVI